MKSKVKDLSKKEIMFKLIEQWKSGNNSQSSFCREHQINYHTFQYWFKVYCNKESDTAVNQAGFIAVNPYDSESFRDNFAEFVLPDGKRMILHHRVEADYLKTLIG